MHPIVNRLILNRPNFRRGWQLAQMAPTESTTTTTKERTMNRKKKTTAELRTGEGEAAQAKPAQAKGPRLAALLEVLGMEKAAFEELAAEIFLNMPLPLAGYSFRCYGWDYKGMVFEIEDQETGIEYVLKKPAICAALAAYIVMKIQGELPGIVIDGPFTDAGSYDAESLDAVCQLAALGEVIYG